MATRERPKSGIIINTYEIIWEIHNFLEYSKNMSFFGDQKPPEGAYAPKTELDKKICRFLVTKNPRRERTHLTKACFANFMIIYWICHYKLFKNYYV